MSQVEEQKQECEGVIHARVPIEESKNPVETQSVHERGKLGLSMCPGKNIAQGRDGKSYARDIDTDVKNFALSGIKLIVCLLNDYEIRSIGCDVKKYEKACLKNGIELFKYPIIEMAPPEDV